MLKDDGTLYRFQVQTVGLSFKEWPVNIDSVSDGCVYCVMLTRAIPHKPITHPTKVDTVDPCWTLHYGLQNRTCGSAVYPVRGVFLLLFAFCSILLSVNFDRSLWWLPAPRWFITVTGPLASQSRPFTYSRQTLYTGCSKLPLHFSLSPAHPCSSSSVYLWMNLSLPLLRQIKRHYCACARRAACVTLAHSAEAKNIPSDVPVMQQAHVIRTSKKSPQCIWNGLQ